MLGESKYKILRNISKKPSTYLYEKEVPVRQLEEELAKLDIRYPFICKPDIGERGWAVKKVSSYEEFEKYRQSIRVPFLIQNFVDLPIEAGVFYYRYPKAEKGVVSSIVIKEMLTVMGDGKKTVEELILNNPRATIQYERFKAKNPGLLHQVLPIGGAVELESIGNHCLGTKFINGNHLITEKLVDSFDALSKSIEGFYYGRFDLRCASLEALENGEVMIMELNGAGAEPAHIYHPGFSIFAAYKVLFSHWRVLYEISKQNNERGFPYLSFKEGVNEYKKVRAYNKMKSE